MDKIDLCKKCTKRKFDLQQGIVCGLINEKPTFEDSCPDFEADETVKEFIGEDLRSNEHRGRILLSIIWIVLIIEVLSLISSGMQYDLLQTISNGGEITDEAATANDLREQLIAIIYLIAYITSGIVFIMWFRRAYFNLHQKVQTLSYSESWAAGSWFVPFVNLYRPFQIMKELYQETKQYITDRDTYTEIDLTTKFLGLWWTLWIVNGIFGQVNWRLFRNAETLSDFIASTPFDIAGGLLGIGLALVTIRVIKDYTNAEKLLIKK